MLFKQPNDEAHLLLTATSLRSNGHVRVRHYYEITIPKYSIEDFRSHFRKGAYNCCKSTFFGQFSCVKFVTNLTFILDLTF